MTTTTHIFLAGATGAVGRALIPRLLERGHTVTGTTRSPEKADALRALGADARSSSTASTATPSSRPSPPRGPTRSCTR